MASPLDHWLRSARIRTRHQVEVPASPPDALATLLTTPIAPDRVVATLFALRRLHRTGPIGQALQASGFLLLEHSSHVHVVGLLVRGGRRQPLAGPAEWPSTTEAGTLRMAAAFWTEPSARGACLRTETRVDGRGRLTWLVFRLYWLFVSPFSSLIRRRWLRAAASRVPAAT